VIKNLTSKNTRPKGLLATVKGTIFGYDKASNVIKESSSPDYWTFKGTLGNVGIRFSRRVNITSFAITISQDFDLCSAPGRLEIWGLLNEEALHTNLLKGSKRFKTTHNIKFMPAILLGEFHLKSDLSRQVFPSDPWLHGWPVTFDTVLLLLHNSLDQSHVCISRFHVYGKSDSKNVCFK
jgi:hypothetical protein